MLLWFWAIIFRIYFVLFFMSPGRVAAEKCSTAISSRMPGADRGVWDQSSVQPGVPSCLLCSGGAAPECTGLEQN